MKSVKLAILFLIVLDLDPLYAQERFEAGNKVRITIAIAILKIDSSILYSYSVLNQQSAQQDMFYLALILRGENVVKELRSPKDWRPAFFKDEPQMIKWLAEIDDEEDAYINPLKPGKSLNGFAITSNSLPGLITYYAEGDHPIPSFPEGMATDSIPGYSDLTPYGPGIVGVTVGPVLSPTPIFVNNCLDTLISYKHQALALKWIDNEGIANSLDQKLENAKSKLQDGDSLAARNMLKAFVNEVEAQKDKHLTSEAYALLKINAEYLIERLPDKPSDPKQKK